jgi:hypothetical protein
MRTKTWSLGSLGNQDRVSAAAVLPTETTTTTTLKNAATNGIIATAPLSTSTSVLTRSTVASRHWDRDLPFYSRRCYPRDRMTADQTELALLRPLNQHAHRHRPARRISSFQAVYSGDSFNDPARAIASRPVNKGLDSITAIHESLKARTTTLQLWHLTAGGLYRSRCGLH